MQVGSLNRWVTFGANLGVLIGIVILILEITQTNTIAREEMENQIRIEYNSLLGFILSDPSFREFYSDISKADYALTDDDKITADIFFRRRLNIWNMVNRAFNSGLLSPESYAKLYTYEVPRIIEREPNLHEVWREIVICGTGSYFSPAEELVGSFVC